MANRDGFFKLNQNNPHACLLDRPTVEVAGRDHSQPEVGPELTPRPLPPCWRLPT